jgi:glycyl-tRNA synthetase
MDLYLRPETAQGIFVNFLNVQKTSRHRLPFGIAQIGKAFRNEIVARQFIFRMREFEQMEMQFFVAPGTELEFYEQWKQKRLNWHLALGLGNDNYRFHDHEKLAHYANAAADIEFNFPFGFKELEGIHSRTDFDLKAHEQFSGRKLQYFDTDENVNYTLTANSTNSPTWISATYGNCVDDVTVTGLNSVFRSSTGVDSNTKSLSFPGRVKDRKKLEKPKPWINPNSSANA